MAEGPVHCPTCGQTDFYVISTGVRFEGGAMVETYRWPENPEEIEDLEDRVLDAGYEVDHQILVEPALTAIEGRVRALCLGCLGDRTDHYLTRGRAEMLPV